ncbi:unnamed protein product [Symbiodinium natans]|uniref:Uncharacterized protein n=1 Tax=Symbiodinium natans TaxID=878477 RepID=A0A812LSM9_9DINO|nr:unnamed protein product [Symbiodinium natans]
MVSSCILPLGHPISTPAASPLKLAELALTGVPLQPRCSMRALVVLLLIQSVWAQLFELFNPDTGSTTATKALRGNSTAVTSTAVPGVEGRVQARRLARTNRKGKKRSSQNFVDEEQGNGKGAVDEKKAQAAAAGAAVFVAATLGNDLLKLSMGMDIYGDPEETDDGIFAAPLYFLDTFHGLMTDAA